MNASQGTHTRSSVKSNITNVCSICGNIFQKYSPSRTLKLRFCSYACSGRSTRKEIPVGTVFGSLTVIERVTLPSGQSVWKCQCECGGTANVHGSRLRSGQHTHCKACCRDRKHGESEGLNRRATTEYAAWSSMIQRCCNPDCHAYSRYGGRGIGVCGRWRNSYVDFLSDMGRKPSRLHSLDRINNDIGYSPSNCRWATKKEQSNNRQDNRFITHDGKTMTISQWSEFIGIRRHVLDHRIKRGWTFERSISSPVVSRRRKHSTS
jgi:hypothetical protein